MKVNHHHGTIILNDFKDPFLWKKSSNDDNFKFFEFISPIISMWVQYVPQSVSKSISTRTLKDLFHKSKLMNYGNMVHVYG